MLSPHVVWQDIDRREWTNLWDILYGPTTQPTRLYGLLEAGIPIALVHGQRGQIDLRHWPRSAATLRQAAGDLRARTGVDQVVLVERADLEGLWDEQQRAYRPDEDYDAYTIRLAALNRAILHDRAICDPAEDRRVGQPAVRYNALLSLLRRATGRDGSFVLAVFAADALWCSVAGRVLDGTITYLTSSQGLRDPGAPPPRGEWRHTYRWLLDACAARLGPPRLGVFLDLDIFKGLPFADDPVAHLTAGAGVGGAILDPWPLAREGPGIEPNREQER